MSCIVIIQTCYRFEQGFRGATAARLTPDQEVACSNHVEITLRFTYKGRYSTHPC